MRAWVGASILGLGLACAGGGTTPPEPEPEPAPRPTPVRDAVERLMVQQGATERTAWLHVPKGEGPMPLVVVFHQANGDGRKIAEWFGAWFDRGVILAFPNGTGKSRDSRGRDDNPVWAGIGRGSEADAKADLDFVESMVDQISRAHPVAPDRIFATGFAAGGFMTWQVACRSKVFDGFAPVAQTLPRKLSGSCNTPAAPLMLIAGTDDPTSLWSGRDDALAAVDSVGLWLKKNRCDTGSEEVEELPDTVPDDRSRPKRHTWTCEGPAVSLLEISGGGHGWPRKDASGTRANRDIDAADEIFAFFGIDGTPAEPAP